MKPTGFARIAAALTCGAVFAVHAQSVKVNGKEIPQSRIELAVKSQVAQGQPDSPELRERVKEALIMREVVAQEALRRGLDKNPEVAGQLELYRQEVLFNAFLNDYLRTNPVTEDAMKKEYERQKNQAGNKEYKASHILVAKEEEAREIIARLKKGGNFAKIAAEKSIDPGSKDRGGELDWALPSNYVKPFGDALAKLKKGQTTETPIQTQFGWHVIRLDDERAFKAPSFEEVKPSLLRNMQQQVVQKALADLRARAKIEN
jgi:peptidyl-prolyl cis-trans isomerase C